MFENIPIDLFNLLIFMMPGFFFLKTFGTKFKTGFEYTIFSFFGGILLMVLYYKVIPIERFNLLLENPYTGAVVFSLLTIVLVLFIQFFIGLIRKISNGTW